MPSMKRTWGPILPYLNSPFSRTHSLTRMWLEMRQIFEQLSTDPCVRAIVLSGAGPRAFTAGLDVRAAAEGTLSDAGKRGGDTSRIAAKLRRHVTEFQQCVTSIERCEKPVICVMHGVTWGLGIDLSTCADVRICARDTRFSVKEVDIGVAADIGTLTRLPKVVGHYGWVKEVCLTAKVFGAEEALRDQGGRHAGGAEHGRLGGGQEPRRGPGYEGAVELVARPFRSRWYFSSPPTPVSVHL